MGLRQRSYLAEDKGSIRLSKKIAHADTRRKGAIKAYKKDPGNFDAAAHAAVQYARKLKKNMLIVPGNSYGNAVFHIVPEGSDITKYTVIKPSKGRFFKIAVAKANGDIFHAEYWGGDG